MLIYNFFQEIALETGDLDSNIKISTQICPASENCVALEYCAEIMFASHIRLCSLDKVCCPSDSVSENKEKNPLGEFSIFTEISVDTVSY